MKSPLISRTGKIPTGKYVFDTNVAKNTEITVMTRILQTSLQKVDGMGQLVQGSCKNKFPSL